MKLTKRAKKDPADLAAKKKRQEEQAEEQDAFEQGIVSLLDFISPSSLEFFSTHFRLGIHAARSAYVVGYPREVLTGWLGRLISLPETFDFSLHVGTSRYKRYYEKSNREVSSGSSQYLD